MACSQSIEEAQNPALCHFCEESNIKWKCINCDLFLCQLCNSRIHSKIKSSDNHTILNLNECGTQDTAATILKVDLHNMPCTIHSEQKCCVYCNFSECKHPICSECLIESHQKHKFKKLKVVYDSIVSEFSTVKEKIETDIKWHENERVKYEQLLSDGNKNFQETKDKIIQTEKEMKETISRHARDLLQVLETKWRPLENKIKTELSTITLNKDNLVLRKGMLDDTLLSQQSSDIFSASKNLDFTLPNKSDIAIHLKKTKFIPGINFREI
ncbi:unnamed protein product [Mytilus coruscus]|uniref:B box-type domain-containing protein n=1 Tax=Mytilus coruscus TaxID=42192 RepID=A0A6J8DVR8_MYTCO|nr:unnamed protein product [Mytilus coruscus]